MLKQLIRRLFGENSFGFNAGWERVQWGNSFEDIFLYTIVEGDGSNTLIFVNEISHNNLEGEVGHYVEIKYPGLLKKPILKPIPAYILTEYYVDRVQNRHSRVIPVSYKIL